MRRASCLLLSVLTAAGCYTYVPLETTDLPVGETLAFQITDRGRVGMAESFGAGLVRVEGRLTSFDARNYVLDVFRVTQLEGGRSTWSGERVRVDKEFVGQVQRRQLSRTRTYALAGVIAAGVAVLLASTDLIGAFSGDVDEDLPDDPISSLVGRLVIGRFVAGRLVWGK